MSLLEDTAFCGASFSQVPGTGGCVSRDRRVKGIGEEGCGQGEDLARSVGTHSLCTKEQCQWGRAMGGRDNGHRVLKPHPALWLWLTLILEMSWRKM